MPRTPRMLRIKFNSKNLEKAMGHLGPWTTDYSDHLDIVISRPVFDDSMLKRYQQLLVNLNRLKRVTLQVAFRTEEPVDKYHYTTQAIMQATLELRPQLTFAVKLKAQDGVAYAMQPQDFHTFLQGRVSMVSMQGISILNDGDSSADEGILDELLALPLMAHLRSIHIQESFIGPSELSAIIRSTNLHRIEIKGSYTTPSCYSIFHHSSLQANLRHADLVEVPFWAIEDGLDFPLQQMNVLETLHLGSRFEKRDLENDFRAIIATYSMPALSYLRLVMNGDQGWAGQPLYDMLSMLPDLKQLHIEDHWFEKYREPLEDIFGIIVQDLEDFCEESIEVTLTLYIEIRHSSPSQPMSLSGLSLRLQAMANLLRILRFEASCSVKFYEEDAITLRLPKLEELVIELPRSPPYMRDLSRWLQTITAPRLNSITVVVRDVINARMVVDAVLQCLPTFDSLRSVSIQVPAGTNGRLKDLEVQCAKLGIDYLLDYLS